MSNSRCTFCQIAAGGRRGKMVYQDETVSAFRDIHPVAPTHILIVPNKHIPSINELKPEDENLIGHLFTVARQLAHEEGVEKSGYRLIINTGGVGQPRDGDARASYAVYDSEQGAIHYYRVPYDVATTQLKMMDYGLPSRLITRLSYGW